MSMSHRGSNEVADFNARKRDHEARQGGLTDEEIEEYARIQNKANQNGAKVIHERRVKNRDKFVQIHQDNMRYLRNIKYLTNQEKVFLMDISTEVGLRSNCLVEDINSLIPMPLSQRALGIKIGRTENNIQPIIKSLIEKGVMARSETGIEDNNTLAYALFLNPNIMYSGPKDEVNETLRAIFARVPKELRELPKPLWRPKSWGPKRKGR